MTGRKSHQLRGLGGRESRGKRLAAGDSFLGDMGSIQREKQPSMQREDQTDHGNGPGTNSSESAVNHPSKSVVRDTEGAAKQKPHATFCGNRGWATAPGDPVAGGQFPCATRL